VSKAAAKGAVLVGCGSPKQTVIYFPWAMKLANFLWIKRFDEAGFSKPKPEAINAFELFFQGFKRIDGKICRHNRKSAAWLDLCLKKISYHPAAIISGH
jgi:hypothetical protein